MMRNQDLHTRLHSMINTEPVGALLHVSVYVDAAHIKRLINTELQDEYVLAIMALVVDLTYPELRFFFSG